MRLGAVPWPASPPRLALWAQATFPIAFYIAKHVPRLSLVSIMGSNILVGRDGVLPLFHRHRGGGGRVLKQSLCCVLCCSDNARTAAILVTVLLTLPSRRSLVRRSVGRQRKSLVHALSGIEPGDSGKIGPSPSGSHRAKAMVNVQSSDSSIPTYA